MNQESQFDAVTVTSSSSSNTIDNEYLGGGSSANTMSRSSSSNISSTTRGTAAQHHVPQQQQGRRTQSSAPAATAVISSTSSSGLMHSGPLRTVLTPTSSGATIHGGLLASATMPHHRSKQQPTSHSPPIIQQQATTATPAEVMQLKPTTVDPLLQQTAASIELIPSSSSSSLDPIEKVNSTTKTATDFFTQSKVDTLQPSLPSTAPPSVLPVTTVPHNYSTANPHHHYRQQQQQQQQSHLPTTAAKLYPSNPLVSPIAPSATTSIALVPPPTKIASVIQPQKKTNIPHQPRIINTNPPPIPVIPTNSTTNVSSSVMPSARSMDSATTSTTNTAISTTVGVLPLPLPPQPPSNTTPISTVDQEINDFLLYDYNHRITNHPTSLSSPPLLHPEPFPYVDIDNTDVDAMLFQKVLHFAYRRQWNHVMEASNSIFLAAREDEVSSSSFDLWKTFQQLVRRPDEYNHDNDHSPNNKQQGNIEARQASLLYLSSHTPTAEQRLQREICIMLYLRFIALVKLRKYTQLGHEIDRLYLIPSTHPTSRSITIPPWIPIGLQIAAIQTLQYTDKPQRCIDTLYQFSNWISSSSDESLHPWNIRIHATLCSVFVGEKEWRMALVSLEYILRHLLDVIPREVALCVSQLQMDTSSSSSSSSYPISTKDDAISQLILIAARIEVLSRQGRILVQAGAMSEAELLFQRIEEEDYAFFCTIQQQMLLLHGNNDLFQRIVKTQWMVQKVSTNVMINKGITLFAHEKYDEAMKQYTLCIEAERNYYSKDVDGYFSSMHHPGIGLDPPEEHSSYLPHCLNNMALCALYSCRMNEAVIMLESLVRESPTQYLTETLAFNLCTLYELGSDNTTSGKKKRILQLLAKRFSLHDIGIESFRIS